MADDPTLGRGAEPDSTVAGASTEDTTLADIRARGMRRRRAVLGDAHVDRAEERTTPLDADFQDVITRYAWGELWQREGIDMRARHLVVLAMMAALGHEEEFAMHVRATARTGVTQAEVGEVLHLVAAYAGLPAANTAFRIAKRTFEEATPGREET